MFSEKRKHEMKSVLVIGLGRFGRHAAQRYAKLGCEVMAVDTDEDKVSAIASKVTSVKIGDCTKEEVLRSFGVSNFDICLVAIGTNFQSSLVITSMLKDLGAPFVISQAGRDIHSKFLLRNGADQIIYPEREMAAHLAVRTTTNNVFDYIELTSKAGIFEVPLPNSWIGESIVKLDVRSRFQISILVVKIKDDVIVPTADYIFTGNERLMVLGNRDDVAKLHG